MGTAGSHGSRLGFMKGLDGLSFCSGLEGLYNGACHFVGHGRCWHMQLHSLDDEVPCLSG